MSLPVLTNARVLRFASFDARSLIEVVDFDQAHSRGVVLALHDPRVGSRSQRRQDR